jgi:hypothetical protein
VPAAAAAPAAVAPVSDGAACDVVAAAPASPKRVSGLGTGERLRQRRQNDLRNARRAATRAARGVRRVCAAGVLASRRVVSARGGRRRVGDDAHGAAIAAVRAVGARQAS